MESLGLKEEKSEQEDFYLKEVKPKKFNYRPKTLDEYIGQENAKALVRLNIKKVMEIKPVHFILSGNAGCGKTTLANIIGNHLNFPVTYQIGGTFTQEALVDFLEENEESGIPRILFIDEIHNLEKKLAEFMYPIVEDFIFPIKSLKLRPFIMVGATTEKSTLIKKFKPLVDRCGCQIVLEDYIVEDMKNILKQYNKQLFQEEITEEIYDLLARNCRFTPRLAIAIFDDYMVCKDIKTVLNAHRIIKDSLTDIDINILKHLIEVGKPVGEEALSVIAGVDRSDYKLIIEPFLMRQGYLTRTARGRIGTDKAKKIIEKLVKEG